MTLKCPTRSNLRWPSTACLTSSPVLSPHLLCSNHTDLAVPRALQPCSFLRAFVLADPFIGMLLSQTLHLSRLCLNIFSVQFSSVHLLSPVRLFGTPWTAACQASLSINPQSPSKPMSIVSLMPSYHLILCLPFSSCPQPFPALGSFQVSQLSASGGQSIGMSASTSVPPVNTQDWSPLGWTGWISLESKGLSRVFSNTAAQKHQFCTQLSL